MIATLFSMLTMFSFAQDELSTPQLLTRYMAKEYCSCRFVVGQTPKVCRAENKTFKILFSISEDTKKKVVTVKSFALTAKASFINDRFGCELDKLEL